MRILQLLNKPQLRGAEVFASQLSKNLVEKGHVSDLLALYPGPLKEFPNGLKLKNFEASESGRMFDYKGWKNLANLIEKEQYDVVQSNAGNSLKFAVFSKLLFGWKAPIVFRNASKMSDYINTPVKKVFNQFLVSKTKQVVSVSNLCEADFKSTFAYGSNQIETIPIGIDLNPIPGDAPADIQHLFVNKPVFVNVGGFSFEKNHKGLLSIFRTLKQAHPDAVLILVGKGPLENEMKAIASDMKISESVHFLGGRTDVLAIVNQADAFLMPSIIEGLPGVILESFYCKTPVIANNVGGISQIVHPGETGWLVEKGDESGFVAAVNDALADPARTRDISSKAYQLATTEYLNASIADRFLKAYQRAIDRATK